MMKHPIKRDMSKAKLVSHPDIGFGMPYLEAPEYIDYSEIRNTPVQVWVIPAPTRYQALKIARESIATSLRALTQPPEKQGNEV